jgi:zinc-binding alcohol dehydrogenase/oxidoreductase
LVDFVTLHRLKPTLSEVLPFERAADAFALMERGGQFGKIVIRN